MCIRDSYKHYYENEQFFLRDKIANLKIDYIFEAALTKLNRCLLYTSDAADERSSVDLGGRRIIKKKKNAHNGLCRIIT